jgi:hypothetical protein
MLSAPGVPGSIGFRPTVVDSCSLLSSLSLFLLRFFSRSFLPPFSSPLSHSSLVWYVSHSSLIWYAILFHLLSVSSFSRRLPRSPSLFFSLLSRSLLSEAPSCPPLNNTALLFPGVSLPPSFLLPSPSPLHCHLLFSPRSCSVLLRIIFSFLRAISLLASLLPCLLLSVTSFLLASTPSITHSLHSP